MGIYITLVKSVYDTIPLHDSVISYIDLDIDNSEPSGTKFHIEESYLGNISYNDFQIQEDCIK